MRNYNTHLLLLLAALFLLSGCYKGVSKEEEDIENPGSTTEDETPPTIDELEGDIITLATEPRYIPFRLSSDMVVAAELVKGEGFKQVLLISGKEWKEVASAKSSTPNEAKEIADNYTSIDNQQNSYTGWRIPTKDEADLLKSLYAGANISIINSELPPLQRLSATDDSGNVVRYLCNEAQHTFSFDAGSTSNTQAGSQKKYHLRLVKTVVLKY